MILKRILYLAEVDEQGHSDAEWTDNLETHKRFILSYLGSYLEITKYHLHCLVAVVTTKEEMQKEN